MGERTYLKEIKQTWEAYYADQTTDTAIKDRVFFELECAELIAAVVESAAGVEGPLRILELGSATGFLASQVIRALRSEYRDLPVTYVGVDISENAVAVARNRCGGDARFEVSDFLEFLGGSDEPFDVVLAQRSIMALMERADQDRLLELVSRRLAAGGMGFFSEGTEDGLRRLTELRGQLGLPPFEKVWHSLYLDQEQFTRAFRNVTVKDYSSLFWLLTRVVYPHFAEPEHNTEFHRFAADLPQVGDFGLVKLVTVSNDAARQ